MLLWYGGAFGAWYHLEYKRGGGPRSAGRMAGFRARVASDCCGYFVLLRQCRSLIRRSQRELASMPVITRKRSCMLRCLNV